MKARNTTKAGPGRMPPRRTDSGIKLPLAIRGGTTPTRQGPAPYVTYAEHDRICSQSVGADPMGYSRKEYRRRVAEALLMRRDGAP